MGEIRIGTSGWHYKHWVGPFYPPRTPASRMLDLYVQKFSTVELNNTFYKLPSKESLAAWRDRTPAGFCFAAKASRFLTHMKKLKDAGPGLERYLDAVGTLGAKLGPILFQLPPNWAPDPERLADFLALLPAFHTNAFEFRHPGWHTARIYDLLARHNIACCTFDFGGDTSPVRHTADFAYIRLHGPVGKYQGSYANSDLEAWARRIVNWSKRLREVYVYFDNDDSGYAPANALLLDSMVGPQKPGC